MILVERHYTKGTTEIIRLCKLSKDHEFSGNRKKRGLYVSKDYAINSDVNGSMNIGRKVIHEFAGIVDRSLAARPIVINPLKSLTV